MNPLRTGIDKISFYTPNYYLPITQEKFPVHLGQDKMAILPPDEDVVTMASNAASRILANLSAQELSDIELLLFATESSIDESKAAGIYVHKLLGLPKRCRVVELKQACYGATAGLRLALGYLRENPDKKVLLLASDVARYRLHSAAESSQGCGAVAMLLSSNPGILEIESQGGFCTHDVMDFWRPSYCAEPFVDGQYSCEVYMRVLEECWQEYSILSKRTFNDHQYFCYHTPVPKLVERAHRRLVKLCGITLTEEQLIKTLQPGLYYSREVGNCYTASLYVGIVSLFDKSEDDLRNKRIGLYSYGSGCSGEYFSAVVQDDYKKHLDSHHQEMLLSRKMLSHEEYLNFYNFKLPTDGSSCVIPNYTSGKYRLSGMDQHKRIYQ